MATSSITHRPVTPTSDRTALRRAVTRAPLIAYFALAFAGTWLALLPAALSRGEYGLALFPFAVPEAAAFLLVMLSAYAGPFLAAFTFPYTWLFNNARGSIPLAILCHASFTELPPAGEPRLAGECSILCYRLRLISCDAGASGLQIFRSSRYERGVI